MPILSNHVHEICMALPDMIRITARDQEIEKGWIKELIAPDPGALYSIVQRDPITGLPSTTSGKWAWVVGQKAGVQKMFLRFGGVIPTQFIDRAAVKNPANYPTIGGRTVTAVYLKSKPYEQDSCLSNTGSSVNQTTFEHHIFLKLNGPLPQGGPYTISIAGNTFPATQFTYNDRTTRACGLLASHIGYRPREYRKIVDFALWVHGYATQGETNLADYGLTTWELIDHRNAPVMQGTLTLYKTPTEAETDYSQVTYASQAAPKTATLVERTNPMRITVPNHGYSTGQVKYCHGFGSTTGGFFDNSSSGAMNNILSTITVVDANVFTIPADGTNTTSFPNPWQAGVHIPEIDSKVYDTYVANRYKTYVYRIDFSAIDATKFQGQYRIRIPGLGVSDPFLLQDNVRYEDAKLHMQGYYHQTSGIAMNPAVGGWARGVDDFRGQIKESFAPALLVGETGASVTHTIDSGSTAGAHWISTTAVGSFIGIRDAGDWDFHNQRHHRMSYWLLEYAYRHLPSTARDLHMGYPKLSTIFGPTWSPLDVLGDQVHMAGMQLLSMKQYQKPDGRVYGGQQYSSGGGGGMIEPSDMATAQCVMLAADPTSNFHYAYAMGKFAHVLKERGTALGSAPMLALAADCQASALSAFNWAENMYLDWYTNGNFNAPSVQQYFVTTLNVKGRQNAWAAEAPGSRTAWTDTMFQNTINSCFGQDGRHTAAAVMYVLTGNTTYGDKVANPIEGAAFNTSPLAENSALAMWEFLQAANVATDFPTKYSQWDNQWAAGYVTHIRSFLEKLRAFIDSAQVASNTWLGYLHDDDSYDGGRVPTGISKTPHQGPRYPRNALLRDREAQGLAVTRGCGPVYYNFTQTLQGGIIVFNFSQDSPINWTIEYPKGDAAALKRRVEPIRYHTPLREAFWDNSFNIYMTEFTVQQNQCPRTMKAIVQHCYDGNTQITQPLRRVRRLMQVAA